MNEAKQTFFSPNEAVHVIRFLFISHTMRVFDVNLNLIGKFGSTIPTRLKCETRYSCYN